MHSLNTTNSSTPTVTRTRYSTAQEIVKKRWIFSVILLYAFHLCRKMAIKSVKNALSFGRRKSVSEEQNLLGSSMDTDRETEDETGGESQEEMEKIDTKRQR